MSKVQEVIEVLKKAEDAKEYCNICAEKRRRYILLAIRLLEYEPKSIELKELQAENERLREALLKIDAYCLVNDIDLNEALEGIKCTEEKEKPQETK